MSGCEWRDEAVEAVAEAEGEPAGFDGAPGEPLLAGAAMILAGDCVIRRVGRS